MIDIPDVGIVLPVRHPDLPPRVRRDHRYPSFRFAPVLFAPDPAAGIRRGLDLYCEAAEIDRDRARRWAQVRAVKAALWGRRHGDPDWLIRATDQLADILL